ncbi:MAG: formylglycine-generating enzyme family protein [Cyanobacteria bacterium J06642_11]
MAEKPEIAFSDEYRVTLPEPARRYAEGKQEQGVESYAPRVLQYFYGLSQKVHRLLVEAQESDQGRQMLLDENANLNFFLKWGYENESSQDSICYSARITALLSKYWQWVVPGEAVLLSLDKALIAATRTQDIVGCADVKKSIGDIQLLEEGLEIAREAYQQSIELYESACEGSSVLMEVASICVTIGDVWNICRQSELAIASYMKAYGICSSKEEHMEAAQIQIAIGRIRQMDGSLEKALASYEIAKQLYTNQNYQPGIAKVDYLIQRLYSNHPFSESLLNQVSLEMVLIHEGTFMMGSPKDQGYDSERPQHEVTIRPFLMGKYPVTQEQWRTVAALPKIERDLKAAPSSFKGDNHPVERVSWYDAVEFCKRLSKKTGREYRLPSEAEWEYACRAGTTTLFYFGESLTSEQANYGRGTTGQTTDVGSFPANNFGLHDMHGNVLEWCLDHWHENYEGAPIDGSAWISSDKNALRLLRGGSWCYGPGVCRSVNRNRDARDFRSSLIGFRVVCASSWPL